MKSIKKLFLIALVFLFMTSFAAPPPDVLFGIDIEEKSIDSSLYTIDPETGIPNFIGETGFKDCRALDFHPQTNQLFATCFDDNILDSILIRINPSNGTGNLIGPLNIGNQDADFVRDISFRSDGTLYAYVGSKAGDMLGVINIKTGNFTLVGETGFNFGIGGIGFSLADVLFFAGRGLVMSQELFILDQDNATPTFVNALNFIPPAPRPTVNSLDTNPLNGVLFAVYRGLNIFLATLDVNNGDVLTIGQTGDVFITAIAFPNPRISNIPTLSQYGLILAAIVLLAAALFVLRRRMSASKV